MSVFRTNAIIVQLKLFSVDPCVFPFYIILPIPKAATLHLGYHLHWPMHFISSQLSVAISKIEIVEDKVACITRQARLDSQL
ncbi:hypothetical protein BT96DRAFT_290991 [Gymnopus androsaceus JB14]|uniref:Uncharacterized protein n=1 Tax=Gymnopus androsaceus JB14 TaxID=1447944 RepID=A0A6A4H480_9AGAR|nr:hypothetical protein BT96DRAFT_290991 [Gymnopus androsaceus JB14]